MLASLPGYEFVETMRLLVATATMLAEHYGLAPGTPLPRVPFNPFHGRTHRFGPAPYLFQYSHQHLSDLAISACLRFLLHGMVFRTRDGQPVALKAHLLRHAFATQQTAAGTARPTRPTPRAWTDGTRPRVGAHRDVARARQRYRRWTKGLLIERLLAVERAYAEQEDRWLRVNDELLAWQLGAAPAPPERAIVRAEPTEIGVPYHGCESPVTHRGD